MTSFFNFDSAVDLRCYTLIFSYTDVSFPLWAPVVSCLLHCYPWTINISSWSTRLCVWDDVKKQTNKKKRTCLTCLDFPEEKVWTVIHHNSTDPVRVHGSTAEKPYKAALDYGGSPDQLRALVSQSEYCQQTLTYQCRRSRLFNTWGEFSEH